MCNIKEKYVVIEEYFIDRLVNKVNKYIDMGFVPLGQMILNKNMFDKQSTFIQSMIHNSIYNTNSIMLDDETNVNDLPINNKIQPLINVKENVMLLNVDPSTIIGNYDGKIWRSNVLTIIDDEIKKN